MFSTTYPVFGKGRILKLEMLENLRDYPKDILDIHLQEYADGILTGCKLQISDNYIMITPGIIYFKGIPYILRDPYKLPYFHTNVTALLKISFSEKSANNDFISYTANAFIDDNIAISENEIELCRFKLKVGAKLRTDYTSFEDLETEYNTVNTIHAPYAAYKKSTISPDILNYFAQEAFKHNPTEPLDISFCMICMENQQAISRELITSYIALRLNIQKQDYTNQTIYKYLNQILNNISTSKKAEKNMGFSSKRILID